MEQDLRYPIGKFERGSGPTEEQRHEWINVMAEAPERLAEAVAGLTQEQLETPHRPGGWTVLQTVHHMADSHMNSFVRCKVALTEEEPLVTSFKGAQWAEARRRKIGVGGCVARDIRRLAGAVGGAAAVARTRGLGAQISPSANGADVAQ